MMRTLFAKWFAPDSFRPRKRRTADRPSERRSHWRVPRLEWLEDRTLLATLVVSPGGSVPGSFSSIQVAVNAAAPGDTILVDPGTYTEQVTINKSLTLQGNGPGAIIQAPSTLMTDAFGQNALVEVNNSAAVVNINNLTIQGPATNITAGLFIAGGATANVTGTTVNQINQGPANFGVQGVRGILVGSSAGGAGHATITNCIVTNYQKTGISTGGTGTTVTITGTAVTGVGPTTLIAQNGIQISPDTVSATLSNNTISGNEYTGSGSGPDPTMNTESAGILNFIDGSIITGNTVFGNDEGIFNTNTGMTATTISGNTAQNNRFQGILLSDGTATVSNNTITGNNIGVAIRASGGSVNAQGTLISNNITNNGNGGVGFPGGGIVLLQVSGATNTPVATAHFNRIVGNSVGLDNSRVIGATTVDAINNWWGSNAGPGGAGSDTVSGPVTFDPWLVLQVTASPTSVDPGGVATIVASLTMNSSGMDTSTLGHVPDGIPILFRTSSGTIVPSSSVTAAGIAVAQFTAGSLPGLVTVFVTIDNQTSTATITILPDVMPTIVEKLFLLGSNFSPDPLTLLPDTLFVNGLYHDILGRVADQAGLNSWVMARQMGVSRQAVASDFWESAEHRSLEVDQFYQTFLGRAADLAGRAGWVNALLAGATETQVEMAFLTSPEYQAEHPGAAAYITGLYADVLGRAPAAAEMAFWVQRLQAGASPQVVALGFLTSPEAAGDAVQALYQQALRRPADPVGLAALTPLLQAGASWEVGADALFASPEYYNLPH
jgi:parallel beta-helix repeat protein